MTCSRATAIAGSAVVTLASCRIRIVRGHRKPPRDCGTMALEELYPASHPGIELCYLFNIESGRAQVQFAVGFKFQGKTGHVVVDAEDALIAALKVKMQRPEVLIAY